MTPESGDSGEALIRAQPGPIDSLTRAAEAASSYVRDARAARTRQEYQKHWDAFTAWCEEHGLCELPAAPETLALYLAARADQGLKVATLEVATAAISQRHLAGGYPSPRSSGLVREAWKGIRRRLGVAQEQKHPVSAKDIRAMIDALPSGIQGLRDRALITLGFAGAFRRSELVALDAVDLAFVPEGLEVRLRRSKTDQEGAGHLKVIAYGSDPSTCPVRSVQDWVELACIGEGALFRHVDRHEHLRERLTAQAVARIIKRVVVKVGLDPAPFAGHSLRAGFVTEAKKNGADDAAIMDQTGHKSLAMVHRYHRRTKKWERSASAKLGL